ncbi:hypothetical protein TVAG_358800 [Trichomonas vaginalis G3]|uniref:Uncharacterized protein n=1 Tax=Trichomonas vaginalis (strain ATCC PRA-98 / G3) TaxID=412133 RepID=A2E883_TRIV3|nr:hypothetical protein TVAGG3_1027550 [Trichomonas vaginalis G3]EAY11101.1 hypothetical protein TVAG_358800 [Trichomonas vaginalis G3]KAI5492618.1 hypothetical protein TVAGG3_1027550 [Trichomonas vaginalis G3]|eukprot:XP_001323324.1 hypothetical protein [Trichomonas vaginalis G3]
MRNQDLSHLQLFFHSTTTATFQTLFTAVVISHGQHPMLTELHLGKPTTLFPIK